jgi:hypothetical protein
MSQPNQLHGGFHKMVHLFYVLVLKKPQTSRHANKILMFSLTWQIYVIILSKKVTTASSNTSCKLKNEN